MLFIAAGGGGDAITASVLAPALGLHRPHAVMTYSWDRLLIDPLPGPRTAKDFDGLRSIADGLHQVVSTTTPIPPAGSALPQLVTDLPGRLLLLDPSSGATGMAAQITAAAHHLGADSIGLVDVGGDILTDGNDPTLRSPLADLLALAACDLAKIPYTVLVTGPGIDGELDETTVLQRLHDLDAVHLATLGPHTFDPVRHVFTWHPSEATGLLALAADGERATVEVRDAANHIRLTDHTPIVYAVDPGELLRRSPAAELRTTTSFTAAAELTAELTGVSELAYEQAKAASIQPRSSRPPAPPDLAAIDHMADTIASRGADYVSVRRLAELLGITDAPTYAAFQTVLAERRPDRLRPPLYHLTTNPR